MEHYRTIGIDLAKRKFHYAVMSADGDIEEKKKILVEDFFDQIDKNFDKKIDRFAFEACGGANNTAQKLMEKGFEVIMLKPRDVKPYAKSRQKNDMNDAIAICRAACDKTLKRVRPKSRAQQEVAFYHKTRCNCIAQRVRKSNSLMTSLHEFGFIVTCGKSTFAKNCADYIEQAYNENAISKIIYTEMKIHVEQIQALLCEEKRLDKILNMMNKKSPKAMKLRTIPGIGPINASLFSEVPVAFYDTAKDFAASLGLVPKQFTTGDKIVLGGITKQGDRYSRQMLVQAARSLIMRTGKGNVPSDPVYKFILKLKEAGKHSNVIAVAVANKLARIIYGCLTHDQPYYSDYAAQKKHVYYLEEKQCHDAS